MPNIRSAHKRVRQTIVRTARNRRIKAQIKTARKGLADAAAKGDKKAAAEAAKKVASAVDTAAKKGTIHKNAASRIKGRAASVIAKL